jgi:hypothetical protein
MRLGSLNHQYYAPERWSTWTAGLIGGAIGLLVMGACWYMGTKAQSRPRALQQPGVSRQGQAPARSHIQLFSHPARHM